MTEVKQPTPLFKRSDGFVEDGEGNFASVMRVKSGVKDDTAWFSYAPSFTAEPIRIEWDAGNPLVLLPLDVTSALLRSNYAAPLTEADIEFYNANVAVEPPKEPVEPPAPAAAPVAPVAPAKAPEPAKTKATAKPKASKPKAAPPAPKPDDAAG